MALNIEINVLLRKWNIFDDDRITLIVCGFIIQTSFWHSDPLVYKL